MTTFDRRSFIRTAAVGAAAVATGFRPATAGASTRPAYKRATRIAPSLTQAGPELALVPGFTYKTFAAFGSPMSDGFITPPIHDGMGVFDQLGGGYRIVRNHELGDSNDNRPGTVLGDPSTAYDKKAPGGTITLVLNDNAHLLDHFISLNGTDSNCSGSPTPWDTWLTCEETTVGTGGGWGKPHGYIFEVDPSWPDGLRDFAGRHDWVIFRSCDVSKAQAIPENDVLLVNVFILLRIFQHHTIGLTRLCNDAI
jgi:secreted PhoX family phosphatase